MSKINRALRLYIKAAANPFLIGFALLMMFGMSLAFLVVPAPAGSKEYLSMLEAIQMGNVGAVCLIVFANTKIQQNKFFCSCSCAKELYIYGPIVVTAVLNILYDTVLTVSAYINLGTEGLADLLIFNTVSSMLLIIVCGCHGKKGVPFITLIQSAAYLAFILFPIILKSALNLQTALKAVLGLPLITAVIINLGGYILAVTVTVAIEKYWWNQGDKYLLPSPAIMKAFGGLEHE